jgi:hypothetical protein
LNFEKQKTHYIYVKIANTRTGLFDKGKIRIDLTDVNEPPYFTDTPSFSLPTWQEKLDGATLVGTPLVSLAADEDETDENLQHVFSIGEVTLFGVTSSADAAPVSVGANLTAPSTNATEVNDAPTEVPPDDDDASGGNATSGGAGAGARPSGAGPVGGESNTEGAPPPAGSPPPPSRRRHLLQAEPGEGATSANESTGDATATLYSSFYEINEETGQLEMTSSMLEDDLAYTVNGNRLIYHVTVVVSDKAGRTGSLSGSVTVTLNTTEDNTKPTLEANTFTVAENVRYVVPYTAVTDEMDCFYKYCDDVNCGDDAITDETTCLAKSSSCLWNNNKCSYDYSCMKDASNCGEVGKNNNKHLEEYGAPYSQRAIYRVSAVFARDHTAPIVESPTVLEAVPDSINETIA